MKLSEYIEFLQKKMEVYGDRELVTSDRFDRNYDEFMHLPEIWGRSRIYIHNDTEVVAKEGKFLHIDF